MTGLGRLEGGKEGNEKKFPCFFSSFYSLGLSSSSLGPNRGRREKRKKKKLLDLSFHGSKDTGAANGLSESRGFMLMGNRGFFRLYCYDNVANLPQKSLL